MWDRLCTRHRWAGRDRSDWLSFVGAWFWWLTCKVWRPQKCLSIGKSWGVVLTNIWLIDWLLKRKNKWNMEHVPLSKPAKEETMLITVWSGWGFLRQHLRRLMGSRPRAGPLGLSSFSHYGIGGIYYRGSCLSCIGMFQIANGDEEGIAWEDHSGAAPWSKTPRAPPARLGHHSWWAYQNMCRATKGFNIA